ncbi:MAG: SPASM domain-containing protein, partial [Acutalibacteraceae bacterium]|nr:SPASM domain-containing protein [Acutalibacteraceae bacterium]
LEYGERFSWPDISLDTVGESVFCYGLKDHFGILCDGTVIPCCLDREGDINLGNIFEDSLENILSSKKATAIRTGFTCRKAVEELCQKCGYATRF